MKKIAVILFCICTFTAGSANAVPFPGPDSFGYTGSHIGFNLRDVSGTGNDIGLDNVDDAVSVVQIGFSFEFYGITYSEVDVSNNGFMSFTQTGQDGCCSGEPIPTPGLVDNYIAGYWQDHDPTVGGTIRSETRGAVGSREFVVGFYQVSDFDYPDFFSTFEMILHEGTNDIELQLARIQFDDAEDKVIGIENLDGTDGIELAFISLDDPIPNGEILFDNEGFCFSSGDTNCGVSVPEPASFALFAVGLAGIGFVRRKANRIGERNETSNSGRGVS